MLILVVFAFIAGIVTVLSPCILPILPIVLSGSLVSGKKRPYGIVTGFVLSFTFFTLFLSTIVRATGINADSLRLVSVIIVAMFGASLLVPKFQELSEKLFARLSNFAPKVNQDAGYLSGVLLGIGIGLVWTPCVGPILAAVITLAATSEVSSSAVAITLAYSVGTAIPMMAIVIGGRRLLTRVPWLFTHSVKIQKVFGIIMILTAIAINFNIDRKFQTYILQAFPQYGTGLTRFETNEAVKRELEAIKGNKNKQSSNGLAPDFQAGGEWLNSEPLSVESLRGKVVIVDFWTYTCINCIRTLPYLNDWYEKYHDNGLEIVGVHTPEFEFEKNIDNLKKAVADFELKYPIVQDNDYKTWRAYGNQYWPAKYIIDSKGTVRFTHFGEGAYDETEKIIQDLLREAGSSIEEAVDNYKYSLHAVTPETYIGWARGSAFATKDQLVKNKNSNYTLRNSLSLSTFSLGGNWSVMEEYAQAESRDSVLELRYSAMDVFLVLESPGDTGKVRVFLDNQEIQTIEVAENRLYEIVKGKDNAVRLLRLEFLTPGVKVYAFTFG
ncbi:cytochrome c biogenesis protein DipZ [Candidatus Microgenomates bacterium]|nr:MAG: cytochrome c biogenesis protein DipZ [Candidatus Microgenomates bacterium]